MNKLLLINAVACVLLPPFLAAMPPVLKNPGIPAEESFEIADFIDKETGYLTAKVNIKLVERSGAKRYAVTVTEGDLFLNEIELNYDDLTTVSERRTDLKTGTVVESFVNKGNHTVHFFNKEKKIDKDFKAEDGNIYSRYAYLVSLRGFPFAERKAVSFKTYMFEYGDALTMNLLNCSKETVTVTAGTFECYKLELSVGGWQSVLAADKYYFYLTVAAPHRFIKYAEQEDGTWNTSQLQKLGK